MHTAFEWLAIAVGAQLYRRTLSRSEHMLTTTRGQRLIVLLGATAGAAIGSKLAFILYDPHVLAGYAAGDVSFPGGQTIVGGLLGGLVGVEAAKWLAGMTSSTGDAFVEPVLIALMIGRVGCFITGLYDGTYGTATTLPWGYDFGDGQLRHPTQIYDLLFALALLLALRRMRPRLAAVPGLQFKLMLSAYLVWRLLIDFLKPKPFVYLGALSGIQLLCAVALCVYLPLVVRGARPLLAAPRGANTGANASESPS